MTVLAMATALTSALSQVQQCLLAWLVAHCVKHRVYVMLDSVAVIAQ